MTRILGKTMLGGMLHIKMSRTDIHNIRALRFVSLLSLSLMIVSCSKGEAPHQLIVFDGTTMGTTYMVKIVARSVPERGKENRDYTRIKKGIGQVLLKVNRQMSTYISDSEISRFNNSENVDWFSVSPDTAWVIKQALSVSEKSGGAFDITVGPLVNLWGFGPGKFKGVPTENQIREKLKIVGYRNISVRQSPPGIRKKSKDVQCDLAAIAKGFGVDKLAEYLDSKNIISYLIEIGGEVRTRGKNQSHQPWRIGIASPTNTFGIQKVVGLTNQSMATSGDYRNYFEKDGVRYSHSIDPNTGRPVTHNLVSVTVVCHSCLEADALATAITVLGPEKGYELAISENLAVFFIMKSKQGFAEKSTPKFDDILKTGDGSY